MAAAPRDLTVNGMLGGSRGGVVLQMTAVVASEDPDRIRELVEPLGGLGARTLGMQAQIGPYTTLVSSGHLHANHGQQPVITTNLLLPTVTGGSARALVASATHSARPSVQLRSLGGAARDVDPTETSFAHRSPELMAVFSVFPPQSGSDLDAAVAPLRPFSQGAYRNFESRPDADIPRGVPRRDRRPRAGTAPEVRPGGRAAPPRRRTGAGLTAIRRGLVWARLRCRSGGPPLLRAGPPGPVVLCSYRYGIVISSM